MGDYTYGSMQIVHVPEFTDDDAERLALLETAFDAAGGRGVEVAEELDALRTKRNLIVGDPDEDPTDDPLGDLLDNLGWQCDDEDGTPLTDRSYYQHEISCGYIDGDYDGLWEMFEAAGISYIVNDEPKYEWLGTLRQFTPSLGVFTAECASDGNPVIGYTTIKALIDKAESAEQLQKMLLGAIGLPWDGAFAALRLTS